MKQLTALLMMALVASLVWGFSAQKQAATLRDANRALLREVSDLKAQLGQQTSTRSSTRDAEMQKLRDQLSELNRLRAELAMLKESARKSDELAKQNQQLLILAEQARNNAPPLPTDAPATPQPAGKHYGRDEWKFAGYATPEASVLSAIWAMREGNPQTYLEGLTPAEQLRMAKQWEGKDEAEIAAKHQSDVAGITGFQVQGQQVLSPNQMTMTIFIEGTGRTETVSLVKVGKDWKFGGFVRPK